MKEPLVSVVIPVYNREQYIEETINSVINQTYKNIEIILVDDASQDGTINIIKGIKDSRITCYELKINKGVSAAFNLGVAKSNGEYIARLDSDDTAVFDRIEKQILFLENNRDISICGSWLRYINSINELHFPIYHDEVKSLLLKRCPLSIGTSVIRADVFNDFKMDETLRYGEDYEFWSRVLFNYKAHNLQEVLVNYRKHDNQLSVKNRQQQIKDDARLQLGLLKKIVNNERKFPNDLIVKYFVNKHFMQTKDFILIDKWLNELLLNNKKKTVFSHKHFELFIKNKYLLLINLYFFHPKYKHSIINQLKVLRRMPLKKIVVILLKKINSRFR